MFAPEGDGCLQRAKREDAGRFSKEGKSLDDFWYFSSLKSTRKEKFLYVKDNTSSVTLRVPPFSLRLGHARVLTALGLSFIPLAPLRYPQEKAGKMLYFSQNKIELCLWQSFVK